MKFQLLFIVFMCVGAVLIDAYMSSHSHRAATRAASSVGGSSSKKKVEVPTSVPVKNNSGNINKPETLAEKIFWSSSMVVFVCFVLNMR